MANNLHGNNNELEMAEYLDGKKYKELNLTMKEFIKYICATKGIKLDDDTEINAKYETSNKLKQDLYVFINGKQFGISLKMGTGNSCHQEKIEEFVEFIKDNCNASEEVCNLWRLFIWADGTTDGTAPIVKDKNGKIICRFTSSEFKTRYPKERMILQRFINENKEALLNRALFVGKYNSVVDFVYHGTYRQGRWISKEEIISYQLGLSPSGRACFNCGNLTIQAWNVSSKGNTEYKRGEIQLKYGAMTEDFDKLMKSHAEITTSFFGDLEEFQLSHIMNKNKDNPMWKVLLPKVKDFSDYYIVKVSSNQYSSLSQKKVKTKSDAYVIKAKIEKDFLLSKEYTLDEKDIQGYEYVIVADTGISIKMKQSKSFTYLKLTKNSFEQAFSMIDDVDFWLTALLIYSSDSERYKNKKIINDLGNTVDEFYTKVMNKMGISISNVDSIAFWDDVRRNAQLKIKKVINNNKKLAESIFLGKHWFLAPYHADFIYESGKMRKNEIPEFTITTGSGRSKGKYTIEIKP